MLVADLMGRVSAMDEMGVAEMSEGVRRVGRVGLVGPIGPFLLAAIAISTFAERPMTPKEAIKALKMRAPMAADEYDALEKAYRAKAFSIAGVQSTDLVARVQEEIGKALKGKVTFEDFKAKLPKMFERFGVTPLSPSHVETVFRNAMQNSYNAGRWQQQTDPDVKDLFLWRYDAVDDDRTRPSHRAMDGVTLPPDDPLWQRWYPPNGHNCRCRIRTVPVDEATKTDKRTITRAAPDAGWSGNPGEWLEAAA